MKEKIQSSLIVIAVALLLLCVSLGTKSIGEPNEVYQVYLNGKKIGMIESEQSLLDLIDREQINIKNAYNVDKVYPPTGLNIEKTYTYDKNLTNTEDIYNTIKETEPFTIQGYTVTITYKNDENGDEEDYKEPLKIYVRNPELIKTSLHEVAETFIGKDELRLYENGTQSEITDVGETITSIYFAETITIKESFVSTTDKIFDNVDDLTQYLMYGSVDEQPKYTVKVGEDLRTIAEDHKLNIAELLIANPKYPSGNALIAPGEVLSVGLINPVVNFTYRKTIVSNEKVPYKTEYVEDNTKFSSYRDTKTKGIDGVSKVTQDALYINGEVQTLKIVNSEVIKEPVNEVIVKGTKKENSYGNYNSITFSSSDYSWPTLSPFLITTRFEYRWGVFHRGIDIAGAGGGSGYGSPIFAIRDGEVYKTGTGTNEGLYVIIKHEGNIYSQYMHLSKIGVSAGQKVKKEQVIGNMGHSGKGVTGTHLHLGIWIGAPPYLNGSTVVDPCRSVFRC